MRISYRQANIIFIIMFIVPIAGMGYFVNQRIQQRQLTMQVFLQNQIDVDRKILAERGNLRAIQPMVRRVLNVAKNPLEQRSIIAEIKEKREAFEKFWEKYEINYSAKNRQFLEKILSETQELGLIEEEERTLRSIKKTGASYFVAIFNHPVFRGSPDLTVEENSHFLDELAEAREAVYTGLNELADVRYIFAQRIVFFVSGENAAQQGVFNTIFVGLILAILIVAIVQYFTLSRPLGDIMLFLSDLSQGKRGQRLYFSSPVREIKASEDIINTFVEKAEGHEQGNHHNLESRK